MSSPFHTARIVRGHRVASGMNGDPRFPGGTIAMQLPHFLRLGLDVSRFHPGTLNVSIAPLHYRVLQPRLTFRDLQWHPSEPAESFSFLDCKIIIAQRTHDALIYLPHPETKPEHFQAPDVLELLAPWIEGLRYGDEIQIQADPAQIVFESASFHQNVF